MIILFVTTVLLLIIVCFILHSTKRHKLTESFITDVNFSSDEQKRFEHYIGDLKLVGKNKIQVKLLEKDIVNTTEGLCKNDEGFMVISFDPKSPYFFEKFDRFIKRSCWRWSEKYDFQALLGLVKHGNLRLGCNADSIVWHKDPTLSKARHIDGKTQKTPYSIIIRLQSIVHFGNIPEVKEFSKRIPFQDKKEIVFWRGAPTGKDFPAFEHLYYKTLRKHSRSDLFKKWFGKSDEIDIGLTTNYFLPVHENQKKYMKQNISIQNMLEYKYILSLEGVDVASNLKWIMASNSLVLMPKPCVETWFMESHLQPWVHYVPLNDDYSDLLDQKRWCDRNVGKCLEIIDNANKYVEQFLDETKEIILSAMVVNKYLDTVEVTVS